MKYNNIHIYKKIANIWVMMMIGPNSLVRQKEGAQEELFFLLIWVYILYLCYQLFRNCL